MRILVQGTSLERWPICLCLVITMSFTLCSCGAEGASSECGPARAVVTRVVDGDTIEINGTEKVRYLLVDAPEVPDACFSQEAADFNASLVMDREVSLAYDEAQCRDRYGRLLAFVSVGGQEVNGILVEQGYACFYFIPPAGQDRKDEFHALQTQAILAKRGLWGVCREVACGK